MRAMIPDLSALAASPVVPAQATGDYYGPHWGPMMGSWGPLGGILMFLVFVAVIAAAVLIVRFLWNIGDGQGQGPAGRGRQEALEMLDKRYARGEIDREEYLQRKEDLQR